ncbi:MAG: thiamine-phosphate kinase [Candidatus Sericytochromatia bacterium]
MKEKNIIELANKYFYKENPEIIKNIGDDCAVVKEIKYKQLFTSDILIEDTHFLLNKIPSYLLGWKSLAVNISDIASMGGVPKYALLSLGINEKVDYNWLDSFYKGLSDCANKYNVNIIGGDTVKSLKSIVINISLTGITEKPIYRNNVKSGDLIFTTDYLGLSGAGFWCIKNDIKNDFCIEKHYKPIPRIEEGLFLAQNVNRLSMMDSSDGLFKSIETMCEQNNLGANIYSKNLSIHNSLKEVSNISKINSEDFILFGGEDYELIFSMSENDYNEIKHIYEEKFNIKLNILGYFTNEHNNIYLEKNDKLILLSDQSFKHF